MASWNYRVVRHANGDLALHEVHYDEAGRPVSRTLEPCSFACDADEGLKGIASSLGLAVRALAEQVLDDGDIKP